MRVKFSTADEFLTELTKECSSSSGPYAVDDQILRLTYSYRQDSHIPLSYLSVVAGVVIRGKIVELHQYVGEVMTGASSHEGSLRVKAQAAIILANIDATARELQLEVRAGMFEP
jgi:hypothetical protein